MSDLQRTLRDLHRELGEAHRLDPQDRALLETTLGDIQRALEGSAAPARVGAGAPVEGSSGALAAAVVRLEAGHPGLAAAVRSLMDALAKAGI
jgi:hypothetical protein